MSQQEIVEALRRRWNKPEAAAAALGLDAALLRTEEFAMPNLSMPAAIAKGALLTILTKRVAPGKQIDVMALDSILADVTERNWTRAKRNQVAYRVQSTFHPVIAMDADLGDVPGTLQNLPPNAAPPLKPATDQSPEQIMAWMAANCPPEMLAKMKTDLGIEHVGAPIPAPAGGAPHAGPPPAPHPAAPPPMGAKPPAPDADPMGGPPPDLAGGGGPPPLPPPPADGMDAGAAPAGGAAPCPAMHSALDEDDTEEDPVDKTAMDAAIKGERENQRRIFAAVEHVRPRVGQLNFMAFDSADDVYRKALGLLNVQGVDKLHPTALRPVYEAHAKPAPAPARQSNGNARVNHPTMAADSNTPEEVLNVAAAFPDLLKITQG